MDRRKLEITVCCFLWGDWPLAEEYVNNLYKGVECHTNVAFSFICFVDTQNEYRNHFIDGVELRHLPERVVKMKRNLTKVYMFSEEAGLSGQVVCFDLDTIIIGNIDGLLLCRSHHFYSCKCANPRRGNKIDGGVIGFPSPEVVFTNQLWRPLDLYPIEQKKFSAGSERVYYRIKFREDMDRVRFWEDEYPGQVQSYKWKWLDEKYDSSDTRVIRFHGYPRPHEIDDVPLLTRWRNP